MQKYSYLFYLSIITIQNDLERIHNFLKLLILNHVSRTPIFIHKILFYTRLDVIFWKPDIEKPFQVKVKHT